MSLPFLQSRPLPSPQMSQLFDELVLPLVQAHGAVAKVLLGGSTPADTSLEDARQQLWQVGSNTASAAVLVVVTVAVVVAAETNPNRLYRQDKRNSVQPCGCGAAVLCLHTNMSHP